MCGEAFYHYWISTSVLMMKSTALQNLIFLH